MIFRDLGTMIASGAELPPDRSERDFAHEMYHIREGFLVQLMRSLGGKHFLPEAGKVNVEFGPDANGNDYALYLNVAHVWRPTFDFHRFFDADAATKEELALEHLAAGLSEVATRQQVSPQPVEDALAAARSEGLQLRYPISSLGRMHPNRRLRFEVCRAIERGNESWFLDVTDRSGELLESFPILEQTYAPIALGRFRKSRWRKDTFLLTDSGGRITFQKATRTLVARHCR